MSKVQIAQFKQAVGTSVPGGPYGYNQTREIPAEALKHPLVKALIGKGKIILLADSGVTPKKSRGASVSEPISDSSE